MINLDLNFKLTFSLSLSINSIIIPFNSISASHLEYDPEAIMEFYREEQERFFPK